MARWAKLPEWTLERWLTTPLEWADLEGSPAFVLFFHAHCEGCVHLALPQADLMYREFSPRGVRVVAIHSKFEGPANDGLAALLRAGGYALPVAIDAPGNDWKPRTMDDWGVEGTPTLVLLDRRGQLRMKKLGHLEDKRIAAYLEQLLAE